MMKNMFESMRWLLLISGILIAILGITMLFAPLESLVTLAVFIGIAMLISGVSEIASFCGEEKGCRSGWLLASGILSALFGIWAIFGSGTAALVAFLPFIFAVWVLSSSIIRVVGSITLRSEGFPLWGWLLAFGLLGTLFGSILLFSPVLSGIVISVSIALILISHGIDNIILFFRIKKIGEHIHERMN